MTERFSGDTEQALGRAAEILLQASRVLILSHSSPDGDTLGSAFALCLALRRSGRQARVECSDEFPKKYAYITALAAPDAFDPDLVVSSDIATRQLFGERLAKYGDAVGLAIDHHPSHAPFARQTLLDPSAAATCEIMCGLIAKLGVEIDKNIANCIYTGLATDTGCFRYPNTTPRTLRAAAAMVEAGAESARINKELFETTSRQRLAAESMVLSTLEYHYDGRAALICLTREVGEKTGVREADMEGIPSLPARIEGVLAGITVKQKDESCCKISVRTNAGLNASDICAHLGGGGHSGAAGCTVNGTVQQAKEQILAAVGRELERL